MTPLFTIRATFGGAEYDVTVTYKGCTTTIRTISHEGFPIITEMPFADIGDIPRFDAIAYGALTENVRARQEMLNG